MELEIDLPFACPYCGAIVDIQNNARYCSHIKYVFSEGMDPDCFVHVKEDFARGYITKLIMSPEYKDYLAECELNEITCDKLQAFIKGIFEPGDAISTSIPYVESIATRSCSLKAVKFSARRTYSSIHVCIDPDETM